MDGLKSNLQNPQLEGQSFFWEKPSAIGILLLHGFTATTAEVRPLGKFFHDAGFTVSGPLLAGHGTTPSDLNRCKWQTWVDNAEAAYQQIKSTCGQVFVGGESMGGLLSLELASRHPDVRGILLYSASLFVPGLSRSLFLALFMESLPKRHINEKMAWQGYRVNPLKAASQLFYLQQTVKRLLPRIIQPTLISQGLCDETVDSRTPGFIFQNIHSTQKEIIWFEKSGHCLLLDQEFENIANKSLDFILKYSNIDKKI